MKKKSTLAMGVAGAPSCRLRAPRIFKPGATLIAANIKPIASITSFVNSPPDTIVFGHCHRVTVRPHLCAIPPCQPRLAVCLARGNGSRYRRRSLRDRDHLPRLRPSALRTTRRASTRFRKSGMIFQAR